MQVRFSIFPWSLQPLFVLTLSKMTDVIGSKPDWLPNCRELRVYFSSEILPFPAIPSIMINLTLFLRTRRKKRDKQCVRQDDRDWNRLSPHCIPSGPVDTQTKSAKHSQKWFRLPLSPLWADFLAFSSGNFAPSKGWYGWLVTDFGRRLESKLNFQNATGMSFC